jgi:transcriptional regulator with XRE-family HTH domain
MGFKENLKAELVYSGMLVKELSALSGVSKYSIDNYLSVRGQTPSAEAAVKIARALGVSVEYLVDGVKPRQILPLHLSKETRALALIAERLPENDRRFALDFLRWLQSRKK